jgi:hypothetical protein
MKYLHKELHCDFEVAEALDNESFMIGNTYADYLAGKWVELTTEMEVFRDTHSDVSVKEVIEMTLAPAPSMPPVLSFEEVRTQRLSELESAADARLEQLVGGRAVLRAITGFLDEVEGSAAVAAVQSDVDALKATYESLKAMVEAATTVEEVYAISFSSLNS